jgi:hypothetical protein
MLLNAIPVIGTLVSKIFDTVDKAVEDKDLKNQLKAEIQQQVLALDYTTLQKEIEAKAKIVISEAQGHSWLQRNWRPLLMTCFIAIIAWNYIAVPVLGCFFELHPANIPPDMWDLLKIGTGGYLVGRTGEKIANAVLKKN